MPTCLHTRTTHARTHTQNYYIQYYNTLTVRIVLASLSLRVNKMLVSLSEKSP